MLAPSCHRPLLSASPIALRPSFCSSSPEMFVFPSFLPSSCFFYRRYLISQGANVGGVNSEGETPLDIAEEEAMEELLQNEINRQGSAARPPPSSWVTLLPPPGQVLLPRC